MSRSSTEYIILRYPSRRSARSTISFDTCLMCCGRPGTSKHLPKLVATMYNSYPANLMSFTCKTSRNYADVVRIAVINIVALLLLWCHQRTVIIRITSHCGAAGRYNTDLRCQRCCSANAAHMVHFGRSSFCRICLYRQVWRFVTADDPVLKPCRRCRYSDPIRYCSDPIKPTCLIRFKFKP